MSCWRGGLLAARRGAEAVPAAPLIAENAIARVSEHVYVISDRNVGLVPNVGIIVGTRATLVVDTCLGPHSSVKAWLADFDQLEPLRPVMVVPSHGPAGDASLIAEQKTVMTAIQQRAIELKRQGKSADETVQIVQAELPATFPGWAAPARVGIIARTAYTETP